MARNTGLFLLALAFSQVLSDVVEVDFIENVKEKEFARFGSRIVSGWEAYPGQIPHQTVLRMVDSQGTVSGCGGSVIHRQWVLTAAHCTAGRVTMIIRAGGNNLTTPQHISESTEWYNYPTFDDNRPLVVQPNDISVIKVMSPFVFTDLVQPIRLQSSSDAFRDYGNVQMTASGHGRVWTNGAQPEILNWVYLHGVSNSDCASMFGSALITANSICARWWNVTSQSVCQGDSGGPLTHVDTDGKLTLVGVTSFVAGGDFGCHSGLPAGFIRTGPFLGWLREVTAVDFEDLEEETTPAPTTTEEPTTTEAPTTTETPTPTEAPTTTEASTTTEEPTTTEALTTTEEPTTTEIPTTTEAPTITEPPTTTPEPEEESEEETEEDSSESEEDDKELADLLKRLEVKVKVKVRMDKYKRKHVIHKKHEV